MIKRTRGDIILRCCKLINCLDKRACTVAELGMELGVNKRGVYRYLDAASLVFPICESEGLWPKRYSAMQSPMITIKTKGYIKDRR